MIPFDSSLGRWKRLLEGAGIAFVLTLVLRPFAILTVFGVAEIFSRLDILSIPESQRTLRFVGMVMGREWLPFYAWSSTVLIGGWLGFMGSGVRRSRQVVAMGLAWSVPRLVHDLIQRVSPVQAGTLGVAFLAFGLLAGYIEGRLLRLPTRPSTARRSVPPSTSGFTLVEVLVVVAVLIVLAGLLFPVFTSAKRKANETSCLSNLKQVALGTLQYMEVNGGEMPTLVHADVRSLRPYIPVDRAWACAADPWKLGANTQAGRKLNAKVSYFGPPLFDKVYAEEIKKVDPEFALYVDVSHGRLLPGHDRLRNPLVDYTGTVLRVRRDGSIQKIDPKAHCYTDNEAGSYGGRSLWDYFTDEPITDRAHRTLNPGLREIPCKP